MFTNGGIPLVIICLHCLFDKYAINLISFVTNNDNMTNLISGTQLKRRFLKVLKSVEISFEIIEFFKIEFVYYELSIQNFCHCVSIPMTT